MLVEWVKGTSNEMLKKNNYDHYKYFIILMTVIALAVQGSTFQNLSTQGTLNLIRY